MSLRTPGAQAQLDSYRATRKREAQIFATQRRHDRAWMGAAIVVAVITAVTVCGALMEEVRHVLP